MEYEQGIAAAVAHPDREHAVTVLESLARSLRRHEWLPERRGAAYDLAERAEAEARRLAQPTADRDVVHALVQRGLIECRASIEPETRVTERHDDVTCLECRRAIGSAGLREMASRGKSIAAAQEIADREGYSVHVGCGGKVTIVRDCHQEVISGVLTEVLDHYHHCHGCERDVPAGDIVGPKR